MAFSPNDKNYHNYGGRGIKVCDRWLDKTNGFEMFLGDMGEHSEGLTLERVDVNGNYEPSNCKWATWNEQAVNKRNSSEHVGVFMGKRDKLWNASLGVNGVSYRKQFKSKTEAIAYRKYLEDTYLPKIEIPTDRKPIKGVTYLNGSNRWLSKLTKDGVIHRKYFKSKQEAIDHRKELEDLYLHK